jgi:hypothetical protein
MVHFAFDDGIVIVVAAVFAPILTNQSLFQNGLERVTFWSMLDLHG